MEAARLAAWLVVSVVWAALVLYVLWLWPWLPLVMAWPFAWGVERWLRSLN
jgi:hypothetical protein